MLYIGSAGLKELIKHVTDPPQKIDFMRVATTDDLVWTHSRLNFFGKTYAAVDIFRVECGVIKEHWGEFN
jgi:predicted SnoaL-like aldol condensation-catalyzing enzyme